MAKRKVKAAVRTNSNHVYSSAVDPAKVQQSSSFNKGSSPAALTDINTLASLLKNPQEFENVKRLYQFCDYYVNYDSICAGAIKNIFIPFSQAPYKLIGGNKKSRAFFEKLFERNNLEDLVRGCANDYFKYANVFVYLNNDYTL